MHPAAALTFNGRRKAIAAGPSSSATTWALMHRQDALYGVVLRIFTHPLLPV